MACLSWRPVNFVTFQLLSWHINSLTNRFTVTMISVHWWPVCIQGGPKKWGHKLVIILSDLYADLQIFFSLKDSTPHFKYLAILHRNLSLVAWFLTLIFHNVVWQHMRGAVGFSVTRLLQIFLGIFVWKNVNRLRFDRTMAMSLWPQFFGPPWYSNLVE